MMAIWDTHAAIKRLMKQGIKEKQAEELISIIKESKEAEAGKSVSKADLAAGFSELKAELLKWYIATTLIVVGLMAGGLAMVVKILQT